MLIVVSPAFNMYSTAPEGAVLPPVSRPRFLDEARQIARAMCKLAPWELEELLGVKENRSVEMFDRWQSFPLTDDQVQQNPGLPALLGYDGIQYKYMGAKNYSSREWSRAGEKVRVISPAYGILTGIDEMHPHRLRLPHRIPELDMTVLEFWGDSLVQSLLEEDEEFILLTSKEYTGVIEDGLLNGGTHLIVPDFKIPVKGRLMTQSTYAKMARGSMVSFLLREGSSAGDSRIQEFTWNGFSYDAGLSTPDAPVFVRSA